ncbi:hypothetical protein Hanom_Chr11g01002441 [Helianthus anomalus]
MLHVHLLCLLFNTTPGKHQLLIQSSSPKDKTLILPLPSETYASIRNVHLYQIRPPQTK